MTKSITLPTGWKPAASGGGGGAVDSVDGMTGAVTLADKYVDITGDTMTGNLGVGANLAVGGVPATNVGIQLLGNISDPGTVFGIRMGSMTLTPGNGGTAIFHSAGGGTIATGASNTITEARGFFCGPFVKGGTGTITNIYGALFSAQTAGTTNTTMRLDASNTRTLWLAGDVNPTTPAGGITFGSSADTALYRSAAGTIRTGSAQLDGNLAAGAVPNASYRGYFAQATSHLTGGGASALRSINTWSSAVDASPYLSATASVLQTNLAAGATLTNGAGEALTALNSSVVITGDGTYATTANAVMGSVSKSGAGHLSATRCFMAYGMVVSGGTVGTAIGLDINTQKAAGVTVGYGVYQRGAADLNYLNGYVGMGVTVPIARLQLAADTVAAGGVLFGTDTNLYRSAAGVLKSDGSLALGVLPPAATGTIRLPSAGSLVWRNNLNTADEASLTFSAGGYMIADAKLGHALSVNTSTVLTLLSTGAQVAGALSVGTNPAQTFGALRLPNAAYIAFRDSANAADVRVMTVAATTNRIIVGGSDATGGLSLIGRNDIRFMSHVTQVAEMGATYFRLSEGIGFEVGTTTGTKIGTAATQKLGFWNATPIVQPAATPAAATDADTTMALVNDLRTKLIALGLVA